MRARVSAGLLIYRRGTTGLQVFLVHPGGPYWARKDVGAWSLPKGEVEPGEDPLAAARRECEEETGHRIEGPAVPLGSVTMRSGKVVHAWAVEGDLDVAQVRSTTFSLEWPPRSGRLQTFPEVDRAAWFAIAEARLRLHPAQVPFLHRLETTLTSA